MSSTPRRATALLISFSMVLSAPGTAAFAQSAPKPTAKLAAEVKSEEDPNTVLAYLEASGVFKGKDDPLRAYVGTNKKLTPLGEVLYRYLKAQPNPGDDVASLKESFEGLRKSGPYTEKKAQAMEDALKRYHDKFGSLPAPTAGDLEDTFRLGTLREAYMNNAMVADPPKKAMTQVEMSNGQGWEFFDDEGLAFRLNRHQITTYNRELQKQQRELNRNRPTQAPPIPETGRYNIQMIELSYWRMKLQTDELLRAWRLDRMVNMAGLLGKQYPEDMYFKDPTLEAKLERWAKEKKYNHNGQTYSVYDVVHNKTKNRKTYLDKAVGGIEQFKEEMEKLRANGNDTITDSKLSSMQMSEQYVLRYLSMVFLESQRFYVKNQLEALDPKSPDSQAVRDAVKESKMSAAEREKYKQQGDKLLQRLNRLMTIFATVQDQLVRSDYAGSLDMVQAALNSSQKDMTEVLVDSQLYAEAPTTTVWARTQIGELAPSFNGSLHPKNWRWGFVRAVAEKTGIVSGHQSNMSEVRRMLPQYEKMTGLIADGKFWEARKVAAEIFPDGVTRRHDLALGGGGGLISQNMRTSASLKLARETLTKTAAVNKWADTIGNFASWTIGMGLGAPVLSRTLGAVGWGSRKVGLNFVAEIAEHAATRVNSLNPAAENLTAKSWLGRYAQASGYRMGSFAIRQGMFTGLSGVISGVFTTVGHYMDTSLPEADLGIMKVGGDDSMFRGGGHAFLTGAEGGIHWANESFHPMLGYVGLPSSAFEGTRFAFITQTLGERGVVGTTGAVLKRMGLPISDKLSLNALAGSGRIGAGASFGLGMFDNVAKYALFSHGVGKLAEKISWARNYDEKDIERRIKKAQKDGMKWMESPAWLLIPVFPAKYEVAAAGYQRSVQGAKEYLNSADPSLRSKLANAPDESFLPLLSTPKTPAMQQMFNFTWKGGRQADKEFMVTGEIKRQAIAEELMINVPGGGHGVNIKNINPMEFLRISQLDPKKTPKVGNLHMTDDVALVAREKFNDVLRANQKLADEILGAKPGSTVKGFGVVTPGVQREVAVTMHLDKLAGRKIRPVVAEKAAKVLDRYLDADNMGAPAKKLIDAIRARNDSGPAAEKFEKLVKQQLEVVAEWKKAVDREQSKESYMGVLKRLTENADDLLKKGEITAKQHETMRRWYEYVEAGEARFQSFNNVEMTHTLVTEELGALKVQYSGSPKMAKLLDDFGARIQKWKTAYPDGKAKVEAPGENGFKNLMSQLDGLAGQAIGSKALTVAEAASLKAALKEMRASPWILHDSKGTALKGWRPGQFESLMESLGLAVIQGQNGQGIRQFVRLTTGGGKTLLTFEGLLPLAEADAAIHGMKVKFLTVQSNLEAQARLEFMSLKKIGSKLEFDTYEGFKSGIAEAKSKGEKFVEKHWLLGDEMDGAALQAALTLGETTGRITRKNSVYHRIEEIGDFISRMVGKRQLELGQQIKTQARTTQGLIDALPPTAQVKAARLATEKMLRSAEALSKAKTPEAKLRAQDQLAESVGELRRALAGESRAGPPEIDMAGFTIVQAKGKPLIWGYEGPRSSEVSAILTKALKGVRTLAQADKIIQKLRQDKVLAGKGESGPASEGLTGEQRVVMETAIAKVEQLMVMARQSESLSQRRLRLKSELTQVKSDFKAADKEQKAVLKEKRETIENELELLVSAEKDFAAGLVHQQNLLGLLRDNPKGRLEALKLEAHKQIDAAERRVQRINNDLGKKNSAERQTALKEELVLAEKELALALRFENAGLARAQKLVEKIAELKSSSTPAPEKLAKAEAELARAKTRMDLRDQAKLSAYAEEVAVLREAVAKEAADDVAASQARLKRMRADALERKPGSSDLAEVRRHFQEAGDEILALVKRGDDAAEAEAGVLLKKRQELMEAFGGTESEIYKVFRKMKDDAHGFARSLALENVEGAAARAKQNAASLIDDHINGLKKELGQLETAPAGELKGRAEGLLKEQIAAWEKLGKDGEVIGGAIDLSIKQAGERNALTKALNKQRSSLNQQYVSALETSLTALAKRDAAFGERLHVESTRQKFSTEDAVVSAMNRKMDGNGFWHNLVDGGLIKLAWHTITGRPVNLKADKVGLTRMYAAEMLRHILRDPVMPGMVRDQMFWEIMPSLLMPRGPTGRGTSYVREEFLNMMRGYYDNPAGIRIDNLSGKINVVHNGQWFESMDNPTRRFWEVHYGTDLTLKYTHKSLSTIKDVTANKKSRFISLSATAGESYKLHLEESGVPVGGQGAKSPAHVDLAVHHGETPKTMSIADALKRVMNESKGRVSFRPSEILDPVNGAPKSVRDYLEVTEIAKKDALAMELNSFPAGEVRDYFTKLRKLQGENSGLVVLSLPDTRILKSIRNYLIKSGHLKKEEIAQVFSDAEWLRINRPEAKVHEQMNLDGMPDGKVKILLLDTRVGGRGLDLDYKGARGNTKLDAFKGYTNYEMLIIDPHEMSAVHLLQAQGRIDLGRVLSGATRRFELVLDVKTVQKEHHFKQMVQESPFFVELRGEPALMEFARRESVRLKQRVEVDWFLMDTFVKNLEKQRLAEMSKDPAVKDFAREKGVKVVDEALVRQYVAKRAAEDAAWGQKHNLVERYETEVREWLKKKQQNIEEDQLRSSSVKQDRPIIDHRTRWLDLLSRGAR